MRTVFPRPVLPGESVALVAQVQAPGQPGHYRLLWDIEEERRRWFSREPGATLFVTRASVERARHRAARAVRAGAWQNERVGRLLLWRAAALMLAEHPLRGVGPDNFELLYGPYLNLRRADPRMSSSNMFLESSSAGALSPEPRSHGCSGARRAPLWPWDARPPRRSPRFPPGCWRRAWPSLSTASSIRS